MKRALITGGTGFVGANLARRLVHDGHEVHLIVRPEHRSWRIQSIQDDVRLHKTAIADLEGLQRAVRAANPEWVFHLAAYGAYPRQKDRRRMFDTNVLGTIKLLDACLSAGFDSFVHAGSSSEYGRSDQPHSESHPPEPETDYASAKLKATLWCCWKGKETGAAITTLRLYSIYGPYEEPSRFIPRLIVEGRRGRWPPLASPSTARDFVYADDAVEAFLLAAKRRRPEPGAVFNVGSGAQTTLAEAVEAAREIFGIAAEPQWASMPDRPWDAASWVADNSLIRKKFGWKPRLTFSEGLRRTLEWYEAQPELHKVYEQPPA